ncbi:hypothetical protein CALCODRAFT_484635 [Calocera cornea HHB12733]|uniref:Putative Zn2Cys6 domain-containing protein n=1 Tax=Calocera cornea HHB12733 TaxID=1353952 RepID=A0A165EW71_9BASI|nr:hypothetical protein CALCODRAFT_484635 [Calocera cornea HHB12733]
MDMDGTSDHPSDDGGDHHSTVNSKVQDLSDSDEWRPPETNESKAGSGSPDYCSSTGDLNDNIADLIDNRAEDSEEYSVIPEDDGAPGLDDGSEWEDEEDTNGRDRDEEMLSIVESDGEMESAPRAAEQEEVYYDHLSNILTDLGQEPDAGKPVSSASVSTTYSEDIIRVCDERERAEHTLLDLARVRPGTAEAAEFPEWQRKLMACHKYLIQWHSVTLPDENNRIKTVLRVLKKHRDELLRGRKKREGGGGGGDGDRRPKPEDPDEEDVQDFLKNMHLSPAQRIRECMSAQELIDDLEREPPVPLFSQANLADAIIGVRRRSAYLSAYFGLIKHNRASPWLQMRGAIATNLINIWTWHVEFNVEAKIDFVEDVDLAFGEDWSILELLRQVETGELGSLPDRYDVDLYSTRYIKATDGLTRPRPAYPNAAIHVVSAFMTHNEWNWRDTLSHRNRWQCPPTWYFATLMFGLVKYAKKWHFSTDIEQWPIPMYNLQAAIVNEVVNEIENVRPPGPRFTDEDLADITRGGRLLNEDKVYNAIIVHTKHVLNHYDKKIQRVHQKHQRKSRRRPFGNILPSALRAPPPQLEVEDHIPSLPSLRTAGVTRVKKLMAHPIIMAYGKHMCMRCRRRPLATRIGLKRGCYVFEGTGCSSFSSKDWWHNKPNRNLSLSYDELEARVAQAHFNGNPDQDAEPPEEWEDVDDSSWLDVSQVERAEKKDCAQKKGKAKGEEGGHGKGKGKRRASSTDEDMAMMEE